MLKRTCQHCGSFLEGYTVNNVTGEFGYRGGDGGWYINETEYKNKIIIMSILEESIKVIGEEELINRAIEEMAELTVAISHHIALFTWNGYCCNVAYGIL